MRVSWSSTSSLKATNASWVGSTALWTGTLVGLTVGALTGEDSGASAGLAAAGVGLSAGTAIGVLTASSVSPSIGHVRLIDLSAVLGALSAGALYFAIANNKSNATGAAGATALGTAAGLGIGWYATASMPPDQPRSSSEARDDSSSWLARWRPMISPVTRTETPGVAAPAGLVLGAQGPLD